MTDYGVTGTIHNHERFMRPSLGNISIISSFFFVVAKAVKLGGNGCL